MSCEKWIHVAMSDDSLVADALLRLRHSESPRKSDEETLTPLKLKWTVRQRRSKKDDLTRASPTTPLSWSCATSLSGGGNGVSANTVEGLEESSAAVKPSENVRSKISQKTPTTTTTTLFKKSRKKKTLAELKDLENMLLRERRRLKNELASMHDLLEQQRTRSHALKKIKAESQSALYRKSPFKQGSSFLLPDLNMPLDSEPSPEVVC